MASASYEELTCSVCLTLFTDPVTLLCGHDFCRQCITEVLNTQHQCPLCKSSVSAEATSLPTSLTLKNLVEKAKEGKIKKEHDEETQKAELCPEHEEKLKLFCVTDQQLACIICRDGEKHEGHKFKPIKEAAASLRKELDTFVQHVSNHIKATERQSDAQSKEITKSKVRSQQLMAQISSQFEEMHLFLRKREEEIKNELKLKGEDDVKRMSEMQNAIEAALSESRELEDKATTVLKMTDPERFLKSWTEGNTPKTPVDSLKRLRSNKLQVVETSLSLEPYESHLQFFVWKEMLQVIQPREDRISLSSRSRDVLVSNDGRSLICNSQIRQPQMDYSYTSFDTYDTYDYNGSTIDAFGLQIRQDRFPDQGPIFGSGSQDFGYNPVSVYVKTIDAFSVKEFTSGQHYWEIEFGSRDYWKLGVKDNFLTYNNEKYSANGPPITQLAHIKKLQKVGIYLNCSSKNLSFYDADTMTLIHTMICKHMPVSAYVSIKYNQSDCNPVTVCWY
ncbi:nuclear factor 7, ovary-like isoform X1 [Parambassis ranga]|uniref:Nuclear factor 7, ovary-like isoform X1 n=1 Tax=Parambassis ranga TaxID=210632 RepID=A0A6P7IJ34_9TELE|nr:nuclear factor 7, ovary-like isoform X1 [Parambassis ranga]